MKPNQIHPKEGFYDLPRFEAILSLADTWALPCRTQEVS